MDVFWCTRVAWQFWSPIRFPVVKEDSIFGIKSWKRIFKWVWCREAVVEVYFTKKWSAETLKRGFKFDNIQLLLESCICKCISWLHGSFFVGNGPMVGFFERRSEDSSNGTAVVSQVSTPEVFLCLTVFTSVVYGANSLRLEVGGRERARRDMYWYTPVMSNVNLCVMLKSYRQSL